MGLFFVGLFFCLFKDLIFGFSFLIRRMHILTTVLITLNSRCIFFFYYDSSVKLHNMQLGLGELLTKDHQLFKISGVQYYYTSSLQQIHFYGMVADIFYTISANNLLCSCSKSTLVCLDVISFPLTSARPLLSSFTQSPS